MQLFAEYKPREHDMSRQIKAAPLTVVLFVSVAAAMPWFAEAASPSNADKAALKRAIVACKAEAKGRKIKWPSRRKYVNNCVTEAMKDHPTIDVMTMLKEHPDLTDLPVEQWPGF
jgi:hypothetical protein